MQDLILHISDSKITNTTAVRKFFCELADGKYRVTCKRINKRSLNQNAYYHGCVVKMIRDRMIELGNDVDSEIVHDYLKDRFNSKEIQGKDGINIGSIGDSTTKLNKSEFEDYLEKIKRFAAEALDIYIPDPNSPAVMFAQYMPEENITLITQCNP